MSDAPVLTSLRESLATGEPLKWVRVNDLPGYVYFNHSAHVAKGIGCSSCHGRADQMPLTRKAIAYWDETTHGWAVEPGVVSVEIGASSDDIRLARSVTVRGGTP